MPQATVDVNETKKFDLKSLPEGYVVLRRMPYGAWLHRQEMAMNMKFTDQSADVSMANHKVTEYEFKECVVDHNLTDANDEPLDFRKPKTIDSLSPVIGNEIGRYIAEMHEFEEKLGE